MPQAVEVDVAADPEPVDLLGIPAQAPASADRGDLLQQARRATGRVGISSTRVGQVFGGRDQFPVRLVVRLMLLLVVRALLRTLLGRGDVTP
jgi:hypothetical protein